MCLAAVLLMQGGSGLKNISQGRCKRLQPLCQAQKGQFSWLRIWLQAGRLVFLLKTLKNGSGYLRDIAFRRHASHFFAKAAPQAVLKLKHEVSKVMLLFSLTKKWKEEKQEA